MSFPKNKQIENDDNFMKRTIKIEKILNLWRIRNITIQDISLVYLNC